MYANQGNTGNASLSVSFANASQPTTSDYTLSFDGANYTLTDRASGAVVDQKAGPMPVSLGGLNFSVPSEPMSAGDKFTVLPTRGALNGFGLATTSALAIAAASPAVTSAASTNTGTGKITLGGVTTGHRRRRPLTYDATAKTLTGFPVGTTVTIGTTPPTSVTINNPTDTVPYDPAAGATMTMSGTAAGALNGVSVTLSGAPATGDSFTIGPYAGGTSDGSNALALSKLVNSKAFGNGTTTLTGAYASYVNGIGNTTTQLKSSSAAQTGLIGQITQAQQSVSGVNTNEEAANLMQYQQFYQANAKVIQTAATLFQTVLGLFN